LILLVSFDKFGSHLESNYFVKNIAVFASGRGSNFSAILGKIQAGEIAARVTCLISDRAQPPVFDIAREAGIPTYWISRKQFANPDDYVNFLLGVLSQHAVDLIVLAGYLKMIPIPVVQKYRGAILNIHPALLPNFGGHGLYGSKVHEAVLASGVKTTGATVHFVDEHYDTGPIIKQEQVAVLEHDTPESLAHRVLEAEHRLYPEVVQAFCEGKIKLIDHKVQWSL